MPDIGMLIEIADFYKVSIPEIIEGERKSETMNQEVRDTAMKNLFHFWKFYSAGRDRFYIKKYTVKKELARAVSCWMCDFFVRDFLCYRLCCSHTV